MSASALPPTAPTTLAIVLGASAWPNSSGFPASKAFVLAAQGFRDYLLDPQGFGLPEANLLDLFDEQAGAFDQLETLGSFLDQRSQVLSAEDQAVRDVLVYFVGHGGLVGPSADFYLLLRRTNDSILRSSGMDIDALAERLREHARQTRRYLFLDCCFAAAAFSAFQGRPDQTAITKTLDAFGIRKSRDTKDIQTKSHTKWHSTQQHSHTASRLESRNQPVNLNANWSQDLPRRGTVLLCSSDQKTPSQLLPDESCTMFSYALLDVLKNGDLHRHHPMSLHEINELVWDRLVALEREWKGKKVPQAPRPALYSPDQSEGDLATVRFFRNISAEREQVRQAEEEKRRRAEEAEQQAPVPPPVSNPPGLNLRKGEPCCSLDWPSCLSWAG